jgi:5'(3')-deoxyribonucleotidase
MIGWRIRMKTLACDVDDCIFELVPAWLKAYNRDFEDKLELEYITDWNIQRFVDKRCGKKIYNYIKSPDIYNEIKPVKDSLWGVNALKEIGYRVIYVTVNNYGNAKYDLLLKYGYMKSGKDFVMAEDKSLIKAEALLDDNYDNIIQFPNRGYLLNKPWNENFKYDNRVRGWKDFVKKITKDIPL